MVYHQHWVPQGSGMHVASQTYPHYSPKPSLLRMASFSLSASFSLER